MLDYKDIILKHYALHMTGSEIARQLGVSKSGVNDFLRAFDTCDKILFPLPEGITNYGIAELVYGKHPGSNGRDTSYELPDFEEVARQMRERKNMTLVFLWNRYVRRCEAEGKKFYQYRQFCERYAAWCKENQTTAHLGATIGQVMEVDFAGKTFIVVDPSTGEAQDVVIFVAVLPYSQYIYAEGMLSAKEPQWIEVNNHALHYFGGVPPLVVCDNCKQAVIANKDWIQPELNRDYAQWADHNNTAIMPAKVRKPRFKSSVEGAVGILEKGFLHKLEQRQYFSLDQFNQDLWKELDLLNHAPFQKKEHNRFYYWQEEKAELMPLPAEEYHYMERSIAKVAGDFHIRFDNAYYSVPKAYVHQKVSVRATAEKVWIDTITGIPICSFPRATYKGQWSTDPNHLPEHYKDFAEWNGPYFVRKAMTVGPKTVEVVKKILKSRKLEVQTYRMCIGILNFTKKYSNQALEECCSRALELDKTTYSFIKNTIASVAEEIGTTGFNTKANEERNKGAFVMGQQYMDVDALLARSQKLAGKPEEDK